MPRQLVRREGHLSMVGEQVPSPQGDRVEVWKDTFLSSTWVGLVTEASTLAVPRE